MSDTETLLFANEAFYNAFATNDLQAMKALWRDHDNIVCIHPGWGAIRGFEKVIASWSAIMSGAEAAPIECVEPFATITGKTGTVVCFEKLGGNYLIATNIFVHDGDGWRMTHHQAGPTSAKPDAPAGDAPPRQVH